MQDSSDAGAPVGGQENPGKSGQETIGGAYGELPFCDLIMKGGITSGVIYPKLITRLSRDYRFKSIGGTSAGAIAAAGCAAAEYARMHSANHDNSGFTELAKLPGQLAEPSGNPAASMLFHLFQPVPALKKHFDALTAILNVNNKALAVARLLFSIVKMFWWLALPGFLIGVFLLSLALSASTPLGALASAEAAAVLLAAWLMAAGVTLHLALARLAQKRPAASLVTVAILLVLAVSIYAITQFALSPLQAVLIVLAAGLISVALAGILALALSLWRFATQMLASIQGNFFGICNGRSSEPGAQVSGLTDWLTAYFDGLAGLDKSAMPLTFGHLWGDIPDAAQPDCELEDTPAAGRLINFEVMTTAVSQSMCYAIPFREGIVALYYDPDEWKKLFPERVMQWLDKTSRSNASPDEQVRNAAGKTLKRLPHNRHLPVVVAVRMSLSFPILLSAVPLYAPDNSTKQRTIKRAWFSDGGISSNMPLHFFDAPLPAHPTFAINLKDEQPDYPILPGVPACQQDGRAYLPKTNVGGQNRFWADPSNPAEAPGYNLVSFLLNIVDTMQNWRDEIQFPYPGYRDRIVQISQRKDEGGLNLDMPKENIDALSDAGECAAELLYRRFHPASIAPERGGWQNHRQLRLRTYLAIVEELANDPNMIDPQWDAVVDACANYNHAQADLGKAILLSIRNLHATVARSKVSVAEKAPRPRASLRISPKI
ncbi:MAG: hypothetical protein V4634_01440 [Pseudomonadota bacterium]